MFSEEKTRFKIFCENMRKAKKLQDVEKGTAVYGITKFADMSGKYILNFRFITLECF